MREFMRLKKKVRSKLNPYSNYRLKNKISKNVLITAHGNSLRALCKYLFNIDDKAISKLEIPTGNPLLIKFDKNTKIIFAKYLDKNRAKDLLVFN